MGCMGYMHMTKIGIENGPTGPKLVVCIDGAERVALPATPNEACELIPHLARTYLSPSELSAFEFLMGFGYGCAGIEVRDKA